MSASNIKKILNALTFIIVSFFFFPLYFRDEFNFPDRVYSVTGLVSVSLSLTVVFILLNYVFGGPVNEGKITDKWKVKDLIQIYPPIATVLMIYLIALIRDPWLSISILNRVLIWAIPVLIIVGAIPYVIYKGYLAKTDPLPAESWWANKTELSLERFALICLIALFVLGLYLRWINIGSYSPHVDEFPHLRHPILFLQGIPVTYRRAFWTVTAPVIAIFKFFGVNLAYARMFMALVNMLAIIPLYHFMKKFGRLEAAFAVVLFTISPIIISMGQLARDYAVTAIFVYATYYFTLRILRSEVAGKLRAWVKENLGNFIAVSLLTAYALYDKSSIIFVILASILIFAFLMVIKIVLEYGGSRQRLYILIPIIAITVIAIISAGNKIHFDYLHFAPAYFNLLTNGAYQNWSYLFPQIGWLFLAYPLFLAFGKVVKIKKANIQAEIYISITFLALMIYAALFLFSGKLDQNTRYYVVFVYYLIPIAALFFARTLKTLYRTINNFERLIPILLVPVVFGIFINLPAINFIETFVSGPNIVSGISHHNYQQAYMFIKENIEDGDAIISDQLQKYDLLYDNIFEGHEYVKENKLNKNNEPIDQKLSGLSSGWIAKSRTGTFDIRGLSFEDQQTEKYNIQYIGTLGGDVAIWYFHER